MFKLHPQLAKDCQTICHSPLCQILLMDDCRYPWIILVPKRADVTELHRLDDKDQIELIADISRISSAMEDLFQPDKLNIGALGNLVPQLHIHIIARYKTDITWPGPVWGIGDAVRYAPDKLSEQLETLRALLG